MSTELLGVLLSAALGAAILWQNHYIKKQTNQIEINVNSRLDKALADLAAATEQARTEGVRADVAESEVERHHVEEDEIALQTLQDALDQNNQEE